MSFSENRYPLFGIMLWSSRRGRLGLVDLLPTAVRIERRHALGNARGAGPQILLVHFPVVTDEERHDARAAVFRGIGDQSETTDHLAADDVVERAAARIRPLPGEFPSRHIP